MSIEIDLSGRNAIVTGAGAGIGSEIARWLARAGARVAVHDVRVEKASETRTLAYTVGRSWSFNAYYADVCRCMLTYAGCSWYSNAY